MMSLKVTITGMPSDAHFEEKASKTCAAFKERLPIESSIVHVPAAAKRCGFRLAIMISALASKTIEAIRRRDRSPYPGGIGETEILLAYGGVPFASKLGQVAGKHFITLTS